MIGTSPLVSVNIPTLSSSRTLEFCLKAIQKQSYKKIEIIVVDSYSSDDTARIALRNGAKVYFAEGLLYQRLLGIHRSKGKYILLLDSDQILHEDAIRECVNLEENSQQPIAVILNEISVPMVKSHIAKLQAEYVSIIHTGDWNPLLGTALPRFFPAHFLKEIAPTSREIGYFDHAFIYKRVAESGVNPAFSPEAIVYHYEMNMPMWMLKKFYKYYGLYIIPTLLEDPKLVLSRLLPRRRILKGGEIRNISQFLLYGAKALATSIGVFSYILSCMMNRTKKFLKNI